MDFEWLKMLALTIAPELGLQSLYVLPKASVPSIPEITEAVAYVLPGYCPLLHQDLRRTGKWEGPGPAIIFNDLLPPTKATEILAHEVAHLLPAVAVSIPKQTEAEKENYLELLNEFVANPSGIVPDRPRWVSGHGREFTRIALHLWWRLALAGEFIGFDELCCGKRYDLSPAYLYWNDLANEPVRMKGATYSEILATPPPAAFNERWEADVAYWASINPQSVKKVLAK